VFCDPGKTAPFTGAVFFHVSIAATASISISQPGRIRRPCESRDPYAAAIVEEYICQTRSNDRPRRMGPGSALAMLACPGRRRDCTQAFSSASTFCTAGRASMRLRWSATFGRVAISTLSPSSQPASVYR